MAMAGFFGCCTTDNADPNSSTIENKGAAPIGQDFFLKDLSIYDRAPDQVEEAEKVDKYLTQGMSSGGANGGTNPLRLQLLTAVRNDDAPGVLQHVADGADINLMGEALRLAAHRGSAAVVRELVAVGLSVNEPCPQTHFTPIHLSSAAGHHVVCEVLLDALADVHKSIGKGAQTTTALNMARKSGHAEVEEVITRHITSLVMNEQGEGNDASQQNRRAHVLPRVSPHLSEAVLQALPGPVAQAAPRQDALLPPQPAASGSAISTQPTVGPVQTSTASPAISGPASPAPVISTPEESGAESAAKDRNRVPDSPPDLGIGIGP